MSDLPVEIRLTSEFQRKLKNLAKKYRQVPNDLQPVLAQLQTGEFLGDQISGVGFRVMKVRVRNSDTQKGKSGGYRLIYWISSNSLVVLVDIYSKSEQEDIEVEEIQQIIKGFSSTSETTND
ncbi:MAG: type II toxin-antitoxin system RelE/ParE family toxin [Leptolyngbya sp. UWPOB_LEPTO1]|uniref:type II toxin-antitoxin system RelE family toxin n=1 Tax=Leptolyngbya sp. UWPOB_LEPTO1 TaxID=2815653 RepID=UPI001AC27E82|nr:type II toxin-antitoxin system RelE/ParE family toxin [Leptolyngbya sp. UWPOB_LEPTO1]MBN8559444.1 type II toxin-antitoxin system RelE/ParE family toxin [Leptolyngbya sp. UWPOB_LEPTO1]